MPERERRERERGKEGEREGGRERARQGVDRAPEFCLKWGVGSVLRRTEQVCALAHPPQKEANLVKSQQDDS